MSDCSMLLFCNILPKYVDQQCRGGKGGNEWKALKAQRIAHTPILELILETFPV